MQRNDQDSAHEVERELSLKELLEIVGVDLQFSRVVRLSHMELTRTPDLDILLDTIEELYLQGNRLKDVRALSCLKRLKFLALQDNKLETLDGLSDLQELVVLDIRNNNIERLEMGDLPPNVRYLNCKGNKFAETDGIKEKLLLWLPNLVRLDGDLVRNVTQSTLQPASHDSFVSFPVRPSASSLLSSNASSAHHSSDLHNSSVKYTDEMPNSQYTKGNNTSTPPLMTVPHQDPQDSGMHATMTHADKASADYHSSVDLASIQSQNAPNLVETEESESEEKSSFTTIRSKHREFVKQAMQDFHQFDKLEKELLALSAQSIADAREHFREIRQDQAKRSEERDKEVEKDTELMRAEFRKEVEVHKKVIQSKIGKIESKRIDTTNV